jgi:hypothetical protein
MHLSSGSMVKSAPPRIRIRPLLTFARPAATLFHKAADPLRY